MFMAERILPYWVKCCDCGKWRQYPLTEGDLTTDIVESWTCRSYRKLKKVGKDLTFTRIASALKSLKFSPQKSEDDKVENNLCNGDEDEVQTLASLLSSSYYTTPAETVNKSRISFIF